VGLFDLDTEAGRQRAEWGVASMYARRRRRSLLLSSSVVALLVEAGMPSAWAASCVHTISAGFDNPAAHTTANVCVQNTSFTGNITNEGTISPSGIALVNGTITGAISSTSVIKGGISLDNQSAIIANGTAIFVGGPTFTGGIRNAGTISARGTGIVAGFGTISTFGGGIANTGTVSAFVSGIVVGGAGGPPGTTLSKFSGGISNGGMIAATSRNGIIVGGTATNAFHIFSRSSTISTFAGGISNSGTISSATNGIIVGGKATFNGLVSISKFSGGIANSGGTITANQGIVVGGVAGSSAAISISKFSGGINNGGTVSALINGIMVGGTANSSGSVTISKFHGGISNSGTVSSAINGIVVGGLAGSGASISIGKFRDGITNSGAITAGHGIVVGGEAADFTSASSVSISKFSGSIVNGNSGTITANTGSAILVGGVATGTHAAVTISTFAGNITNTGAITAATNGIFVGGMAGFGGSVSISTFSGGISNAGMISSAIANGIMVGGSAALGSAVTVGTFGGGIANTGTINANIDGIVVGGLAQLGSGLTIGTFENGITNGVGGSITANTGIQVGGTAILGGKVTLSTFAGNIVNSGNISATGGGLVTGAGIWLGGQASFGSALTIDTFNGSISNNLGGTIAGNVGIMVGGRAAFGSSVTIGTFADGINNAGVIAAQNAGIWVGGVASFGGAVTIKTFAGGISNSGMIAASGVGIFVGGFSGAGSPVTISTFSGGITNSGLIIAGATGVALTDVSTFMGNVWNRGMIVAGSAGIFVCDCATFAGGSIVNTGSITAQTGILVHNSTPVSIFNSGTIFATGPNAVDLTHASGGNTFTLGPGYSITGNVLAFPGGTDTFQLGGVGSDSFDLSSVGPSAQYQNFANFNVVSGIWTVFNTFGQSEAWNVDGGLLAGTGTLAALNVNNGGTLAPGNIGAPGTFMTVTGDLTFQPGAIYLVQLDPTAASRVNVGGMVSLAGAVDGFLSPGSYNAKTTYDILDPTGITGTFTGFTALNMPGFGGTLTYLPNEVLLNLTAQLGAGGGLNVNQQNVANGINTAFNNGDTLPANLFPLFRLTGGNLGNALTQLDGELNTGAERGAFQLMNQYLNLMLDPYVDGRGNGGGGPLGFAPDQQADFPADIALAYDSVLKAPAPSHPSPASGGGSGWGFDQRWSVWGSAFGGASKTDGDPVIGSTTLTASDYGFAAGMDYRMNPDTVVGFSLGGGGTGWNLAQALGSGRSDAFLAGAYGTTQWGPAYLAGAVGFANHWFATNRIALGDQITANFMGQSYGARLEGGYRYAVPAPSLPFPASGGGLGVIGIAPYAALQTQWFQTPAYSETDFTGGGFGLTYSAATANDTRGELGARFDDLLTLDGKALILRGRLAWAHDWVSDPALNANLQALPGSTFTVFGVPIPSNSALTTASAELRFAPRWSLTAKFDGELASGSQTYAGTGTLRYTW
jgi:hypothetical protein